MNCHEYRGDLLDLARRVGADATRRQGARAHTEECQACRLFLERQETVTAGLRALADATRDAQPAGALGDRLQALFDERQATAHPGPANQHRLPAWLRVAAAVLIGAGAIAWWQMARSPRAPEPGRSVQATGRPATAPQVPLAAGVSPAVAIPALQPALPPPGPGPTRRSGNRTPRALSSRIVQAEGFRPLPLAAALPDFESGEIVRTEVPLTSLPLYGISIPPDAEDRPVLIDLLVGQDGHPRAVRLVTNDSQESRSRQ